ncbi:MAG: hypothetical protein ACI9OJ_005738 [Myxococcota bacterium]|jgi:hypothetical protein
MRLHALPCDMRFIRLRGRTHRTRRDCRGVQGSVLVCIPGGRSRVFRPVTAHDRFEGTGNPISPDQAPKVQLLRQPSVSSVLASAHASGPLRNPSPHSETHPAVPVIIVDVFQSIAMALALAQPRSLARSTYAMRWLSPPRSKATEHNGPATLGGLWSVGQSSTAPQMPSASGSITGSSEPPSKLSPTPSASGSF